METTGGWGVALSVGLVGDGPDDLPAPEPGVAWRRTRLTEILPVGSFDAAGCARELRALADVQAQLDAYRLAVVKRMADLRPDLWDLTPDDSGGRAEGWTPARTFAGVTEFFADEVALVLGVSRTRADTLANTALVLTEQLTTTWEALADGRIDLPRAQALVTVLGWQAPDHVDAETVATVEREALAWAVAGESAYRLRDRTAALLLEADAAAADRRRKQAQRHADVQVRRGVDGMAQLVVDLAAPVAAACRDAIDGYARMWKADGDPRPIGQLRSLVAADLVLRPWDATREPVTAHLTVLAPLPGLVDDRAGAGGAGPDPAAADPTVAGARGRAGREGGAHSVAHGRTPTSGSVDGQPVTAAHLRELLTQLDALCPGGLQAPVGGSLTVDLTDPGTGRLRATLTRGELERLARRGCPDHPDPSPRSRPPTASPAGRASGAGDPAGLPDHPAQDDEAGPGRSSAQRGQGEPRVGIDDHPPTPTERVPACACPVAGRPPRTDSYRPTAAQRRHLAARDRGCRHPGCSRPAARTDVDHVVPWLPGGRGGDTDCANLCCLCRRHHRIKTHAPGWRYALGPDGVLTVTTPSGVSRSTRPPGVGPHLEAAELLVPIEQPPGLPDDTRTSVVGVPASRDDDPPPF